MIINSINHLSPREAFEECRKGAIILDLRRDFEIAYKGFDVPEVIFSDPDSIKEFYTNLPADKKIIVADNAGLRSKEICEFLIAKGLTNINNLIGGMFEWDRDGISIKINNREQLSGSCLCMLKPMNKLRNKQE